MKVALNAPVVATTDPAVKVELVIWIARLRTGRVAIFQASVSRTSNAAAAEISAVAGSAVEDLAAVIASEAVADLEDLAAVVIALVVVDLVASGEAALADSVAAGVDGNELRS